ncbi:MAG: AraC family transcriptional regulator [Gammaproteobacteria bacterium]|nr:AraC family transcriptional regulator [Gammaproteobacteria bacterium]
MMHVPDTRSFPLRGFALVETSDLTLAQAAVSREIDPHRFTCATSTDLADSRITCVRLPRTRLFGVHLGSNVLALTPPSRSLQMVVPLSGELLQRRRDGCFRAQAGEGLIHAPGEPVDLLWKSHCTGIVVWIEQQPFTEMLGRMYGATKPGDLRFRPVIDLTRGAGLSISDALKIMLVELEDDQSLLSRGVTTKQVEELLLTALLHAAICTDDRAPQRLSAGFGTLRLRRALEFIHAHLHEDLGVQALATITGVCVRTLQYEFVRDLGVGPMTYIRREKLARVRQDLLRASPNELTIIDAAARWGFYDPKYFSKLYQREFGERPSATLRRDG